MKRVLSFALLILTGSSAIAHDDRSPEDEILSWQNSISLGAAAPDFRVTNHRFFRRPDGRGFMIGYNYLGSSFPSPSAPVLVLSAYGPSGEREWVRTFPQPSGPMERRFNAATELRAGGFVVGVSEDFVIHRLDPAGEPVWQQTGFADLRSQGYFLSAHELVELSDGSIAVLGSKVTSNIGPAGHQELVFGRVSSNNRLLWKTLAGGGTGDMGRALAELPEQSIVFGAKSHGPPNGDKTSPHFGGSDIWLAKHAYTGDRLWDVSLGGSGDEDLVAIHTNSQGVVLFGTTTSGVSGNKTSPSLGSRDVWIVQLDFSGDIISDSTHGTPADDTLTEVFPMKDGGWLLKFVNFHPFGAYPTTLLSLDSDLTERWRQTFQQPGWVSPTSAGTIRWYGPGFRNGFEHLHFSAAGGIISAQQISGTTTPRPSLVGYFVEIAGGNFLGTDFSALHMFRAEAQEAGTPSFVMREEPDVEGVQVSVHSTFPGAAVFYTLDNTAPSSQSTRYTGPFQLDFSSTIHVIAFNADFSAYSTNSIHVTVMPMVHSQHLTVHPVVGGLVRFEGPVWHDSAEFWSIISVSNAVYSPKMIMGRPFRVTALPDSGAEFLRWDGDTNSTNMMVQFIIDTDKQVQALFGTRLDATASDHGEIVVDGIPGKRLVPFGPITLQAIPNTGYYFSGWGGTASGSTNPLALTVTSTYPSASATFLPLGANEAAPTAIVLGPGSVSLTPRKNVYAVGEPIVLRAEPTPGAMFIGWIGATNTASPELSVTATGSERYTALFAGPTQDGFVTALPASPGATVLTSTNLVDWTPAQNVATTHGANIIIDPAPLSRARYYRPTSAN